MSFDIKCAAICVSKLLKLLYIFWNKLTQKVCCMLLLNPTLTPRPPRFVRCALLLVLTPQGFHKRAHLTKVGVEAWHHAVFASTRHP